ncbi:MAG: hypothetical protein EXR72_06885 [Myxococcales bacterium]|nr:hypothetical protein [Myxococcales bacterium]
MALRKTTIYLPEPLRRRLRDAAMLRDCSVNDLLLQGAERVLDSEVQRQDAATLKRLAGESWDRLRGGLYSGPPATDRIDQVVYDLAAREPSAGYGPPRPRARPAKKRRGP